MRTKDPPVRVLLVADGKDDFYLIRNLLSQISLQKYELEWEVDYDAALEALVSGIFDICLLDFRPGVQGCVDLPMKASSRGASTPLILLAGAEDYGIDPESMRSVVADYLIKKGVSANALERSIRHSIDGMRVRNNLRKSGDRLGERFRERTKELLKAHRASGEGETVVRSLLDALSAHIAILDENGLILCTNGAWEVFGKSNELIDYDFLGVNYLSVCERATGEWAEGASAAAAGIREVISGSRDLFTLEYPCHSPSEKRWFSMSVARFKDCTPPRVVLAHENITEGKLAGLALEEQNARIQAILDDMPAGVTMFEGEPLKPVLANRRAIEILGRCMPAEIAADKLASYLQAYRAGTDDLYPIEKMPIIEAMRGESSSVDDMEIQHPDGSRLRVELLGAPVRNSAGRVIAELAIFQDVTWQKQAEEMLKEGDEKFRELAENIREIFWVQASDKLLYINPAYERICGRSCESIYEDAVSFLELIHPEDKEQVLFLYRRYTRTMHPFEVEFRVIRPDRATRWIRARSFPIWKQSRAVRMVGVAEDVTVLKEAEEFLRIERGLAFGLGATGNLTATMELMLEACLRLDSFDAGGIHLLDGETGVLRLVCHQGLSDSLVEQVVLYELAPSVAHFSMQGVPAYWSRRAGDRKRNYLLDRDGIKFLAAIPVKVDEEVVAILNLASHVKTEIPENVRIQLEVITAHIGDIVSRFRLSETVKAQEARLQEANAALTVLLKRREEDRVELEESLLKNVKQLISPCLDRLKRSCLAGDQKNLVDIIESCLREITSPFVHKISASTLGLTPTEIRVADLIRQGKRSKEIADVFRISERAVVFHRQGIRRKLGLTGRKLNLQTYLGALE
jgi:PAS domain S-box-containing protein